MMNGKTAVILLSGLLAACVQAQPPASAPPAPPPAPAAATAPAPVAEPMPANRIVVIRRATCERLLELSPEDRAAASMFYLGYHAARIGARTINVSRIPDIESMAVDYCAARPNRPAVEAFAQAYYRSRR